MTARVLIADDHRLLAEAFERLLAPDYEVVGRVEDGEALLAAVPKLRPDAVVLDVGMPRMNGIDACRRVHEAHPEVRFVVVTMHEDAQVAADALRAGASAYVVKSSAADELREALEAALDGRTWVTPRIDGGRLDALLAHERSTPRPLTPRQREVLRLLAQGLVMKQVADALGVTPRTIAFHKYRIMNEQGVNTPAGLYELARRQGLV